MRKICLVDCLSAGLFPVPGSWFPVPGSCSVQTAHDGAAFDGKDDEPVKKEEVEETKWFWEVGGAAQQ